MGYIWGLELSPQKIGNWKWALIKPKCSTISMGTRPESALLDPMSQGVRAGTWTTLAILLNSLTRKSSQKGYMRMAGEKVRREYN